MESSINIKFFISLLITFIAINCANSKKLCRYTYNNGFEKNFFCESYEDCCGQFCCKTRHINFYQLWYFWLMIILMLLMCSGGGWWYRFRYRNHFQNQQSPFNFPGSATPTLVRPHVYGARPFQAPVTAQGPPPPYPTQGHMPPSNVAVSYPLKTINTPFLNAPTTAPPPYTGPPPSYDDATGHASSNL